MLDFRAVVKLVTQWSVLLEAHSGHADHIFLDLTEGCVSYKGSSEVECLK